MNQQTDELFAVQTQELQVAIEQALTEHLGAMRRVTRITRCSSDYRSTFPLEELALRLEDGRALQLIFKNLAVQSLSEAVRRSKPQFVWNSLREIDVYRTLLAQQDLGTATYYGAVADPVAHRYWLFLEKVSGRELYQVGDLAVWQHAARWLAVLHSRFAGRTESLACGPQLLRYDGNFFRQWLSRAQTVQRARRAALWIGQQEHLARAYEKVIDRLTALPVTLIHGEFYASNVLVQGSGDRVRVCPVDWEMAALGTGLIDLAALTAGHWRDDQRAALALAYYHELAGSGLPVMPFNELLEALDYCRLHLAVQWLGWSADWTPPPEHRQDWLADARRLIAKLGLN